MKQDPQFFRTVCNLAVPVALQSMLQSSFSVVDQIMIGQLGSVSVAGVGLAGKFAGIFSVLVAAVGTVAGIMIAQYMGQKNRQEVRRSFYLNLFIGLAMSGVFSLLCGLFPRQIMGLYTTDPQTLGAAAEYLRIIAGTFLPIAGATLMAAMFRCMEKTQLPLYASLLSALLNTGMNYILIFGKLGFAPMGARGAALATLVSQYANALVMLLLLLKHREHLRSPKAAGGTHSPINWTQYWSMLLPILICEFVWSLGENVYAAIYGHMGTQSSAAMTLINPVQGLMIGVLCGLSQAAGVLIGKRLGNGEYDEAYSASKKLMFYGFVGSAALSVLIAALSGYYVEIYRVEDSVKQLTRQILLAYAVVAPFKVQNMILGGGIIQSGGKTKYVMVIDSVGTWGFGVPLGLLSAFVLKLPIPWVYFILSLEECVRFAISVAVFRRRSWMRSLESAALGTDG